VVGALHVGAALVCIGVQSIPGTVFQFDPLLGPLLSFVYGVRAVFLDAFKKRDDCPALCLADSVFVFLVNLIKFFLYSMLSVLPAAPVITATAPPMPPIKPPSFADAPGIRLSPHNSDQHIKYVFHCMPRHT
jgi:hypothetical protein